MNITAHPVAPEEVMAFLDGELSAAEAQAVSTHIEHCADCAKLTGQFRNASQSLAPWNVEAAPVKLEKTIAESIGKAGSRLDLGKALAVLLLVVAISVPDLYRIKKATMYSYSGSPQTERDRLGAGSAGIFPANQPIARLAAHAKGLSHSLGDHTENSSSFDVQAIPSPMIARTVSLSIVAKDFAASRSLLDSVLARHQGYFGQLNISTPENAARSLQASLRIPAAELPAALADLKKLGRVETESQSGEEVTQQHFDLVARLKTSRETEQRFRAILQQRTGKLSDVLEVEQEIARVRGDIETMEGEQKELEHRVSFATVALQLTEEYKAQLNPPAASISTRIYNAFVDGYHNASETLLGVVIFFAVNGPTILIWIAALALPAIFVWRRYRRTLAAL
jgi:hypothetical protein